MHSGATSPRVRDTPEAFHISQYASCSFRVETQRRVDSLVAAQRATVVCESVLSRERALPKWAHLEAHTHTGVPCGLGDPPAVRVV